METQAAIAAAAEMERIEAEEQRRIEISERIAEERRRLNIRIEIERRIGLIEIRYKETELALEALHGMQSAALKNRHVEEQSRLDEAAVGEVLTLASILSAREEELGGLQQTRWSSLERQHLEETEALVAGTELAEDEYWFKMQMYLNGKPNADSRMAGLMKKFRETKAAEAEKVEASQEREKKELERWTGERWWELLKEIEGDIETKRRQSEATRDSVEKIWYCEMRWMELVRNKRRNRFLALRMHEEEMEQAKMDDYLRASV